MTPSAIDPATFWFVAQCLNRCASGSVPPVKSSWSTKFQVRNEITFTDYYQQIYNGYSFNSQNLGSVSQER
jgi:hypothetical protein